MKEIIKLRTPLAITFAVWKALFLREAVTRLSTGRAAWLWLMLEPLIVIIFHLYWYSALLIGSMYGMDIAIWFMLGFSGYFLFNRIGKQSMNALNANQTLFAYQVVKPIDTVIIRAALEGFIMTVTIGLLCIAVKTLSLPLNLSNFMLAIEAWVGLGLLGLGYGMIFSVINDLVPEIEKLLNFITLPLYFVSGVFIPVLGVPEPYHGWIIINPIVHGIEYLRIAFGNGYIADPSLSLNYLYGCALSFNLLGLALHKKYAIKLVTL